MSAARALCLAALCTGLVAAEDPEGKPAKTEYHHTHRHSFGGYVQGILPTNDLSTALDGQPGVGIGLEWIHRHRGPWSSRTRFEWNTFPEGNPVDPGQVRTSAMQYLLSFDRFFHFGEGLHTPYLVGGLGGTRWFIEQHSPEGLLLNDHTTKLAVTGGVGMRISNYFALEARYVTSGIKKSFDSNTAQLALSWRF